MKGEKNTLVMGALAGLILLGGQAFAETKPSADEKVMCYGVNSCKGQGACAGKVDACSGKNNCSSEITCSGHNSCKGKGLVKLSKKECADKGGKVATK
jgi:hypothetical protein